MCENVTVCTVVNFLDQCVSVKNARVSEFRQSIYTFVLRKQEIHATVRVCLRYYV